MPLALVLALLASVPPTLTAAPATSVTVDGVLDEAEWAAAEVGSGFTQFRPDEGRPATQRTEVRILRGANAVYVGAVMHDASPDDIRTTLSRRDNPEGDFFLVAFDAYNDGRTAYEFAVTASNVQFDAVNASGNEDESWDAVWASATRVTPEGWVAEIEIPYSQLRFTGTETAWGLNFVRMVRRLEEQTFWAPLTSDQANAGFVEFFGTLEGMAGLRPPRVAQLLPYSLARARRFEGEVTDVATADYGTEVGADVKLGLASNVILDATINPDFGQVEADPAQLNLSTFETVFEERRPFFLEGTQIFDLDYASGDGALLYTRRVGGASPIIGAAKLTGRTDGGLSFGVLGATTGESFDPNRLYAAARLKQELGAQSAIGGGATAYSAWGPAGDVWSAAAAADWGLRLGADKGWLFEGTATGTARSIAGAEAGLGHALYIGLDRVKGYFTPGFGVRAYSDGFQLNDVGRFRQTDLISARAGANRIWNRGEPVGPFRRIETSAFGTQEWRYTDGQNRGFNGSVRTGGRLRGFQQVSAQVQAFGIGGFDVREARGLGDVENVSGASIYVEAGSDSRRRFRGYVGAGTIQFEDGGASYDPGAGLDWTVSDRFTLSVDGSLSFGTDQRAWVVNDGFRLGADGLAIGPEAGTPDALPADGLVTLSLSPAEAAALFDSVAPYGTDAEGRTTYYRPVFASRDTRSANLTTRANVLFSSTLSVQLYGQLFAARGRYDGFRLLAAPDDLRDFDSYARRQDFAFSTFNVNAVLRWEYRPGSALYVVWTQARDAEVFQNLVWDGASPLNSPFGATTGRQVLDTFDAFPDNVFLVKLSYLFMR